MKTLNLILSAEVRYVGTADFLMSWIRGIAALSECLQQSGTFFSVVAFDDVLLLLFVVF